MSEKYNVDDFWDRLEIRKDELESDQINQMNALLVQFNVVIKSENDFRGTIAQRETVDKESKKYENMFQKLDPKIQGFLTKKKFVKSDFESYCYTQEPITDAENESNKQKWEEELNDLPACLFESET